jgi:hypothetical protein
VRQGPADADGRRARHSEAAALEDVVRESAARWAGAGPR